METFRCPTCIGVINEPRAPRCPSCGQNIRRRKPVVLGDDHRKGAYLPVDRWMLARLHAEGPRARRHIAPVAWHGKFETSPLAEPDFAAMPSPVATALAPPTVVEPEPELAALQIDTEPAEAPTPTVGALALDAYTRPAPNVTDDERGDGTTEFAAIEEDTTGFRATELAPEATVVAVPEATVPADVDDEPRIDAAEPVAPMAYAPEPLPAVPTGPAMPRPVPHEELDPEVRALVDDLYEQARQELSGNNDMAFFAPFGDHNDLVDIVRYEPPVLQAEPEPDPVIVNTIDPLPPVAAEEPAPQQQASETARSRRGWQPAFVTDDTRKRNLSE